MWTYNRACVVEPAVAAVTLDKVILQALAGYWDPRIQLAEDQYASESCELIACTCTCSATQCICSNETQCINALWVSHCRCIVVCNCDIHNCAYMLLHAG